MMRNVTRFRTVLVGLVAVASMGLAVPASRLFCDLLARHVSLRLSILSDSVQVPPAEPFGAPSAAVGESLDELAPSGSDVANQRQASKATKRKSGSSSSKPRGVLVRRSVVLLAVQRGIRPSAHSVGETSDHPAGLAVYGWGAAGSGLQDGDIITRIGGHRPSCVEDVVAAVVSAYRKKVYAVSGTLFRNGEEFRATVELPIPDSESPQ